MQTTDIDVATNDLGPLAWVLDELRKSLDGAVKAMRRFSPPDSFRPRSPTSLS